MSTRESWPGEDPDVKQEVEEAEEEAAEVYEDDEDTGDEEPQLRVAAEHQHVPGELDVPDDIDLLEGEARSVRRGVGIVASRANVEIANKLLEAALAELDQAGIAKETITVMAVPGAFELPLGAMALAKTRRYSCIVALGCVIRDDATQFELVTGEAASGLQLAALETGVPVAFGVLTVDSAEEAESRVDRGAEAVRTALEMADLFSQLRASASAT